MSAVNSPDGGSLTTMVEAQRGMTPSEALDFLTSGIIPDLSQPPVLTPVDISNIDISNVQEPTLDEVDQLLSRPAITAGAVFSSLNSQHSDEHHSDVNSSDNLVQIGTKGEILEPPPGHETDLTDSRLTAENSSMVADSGEHDTDGMIALIPSLYDAERLVVDDGETIDDLHLTLCYFPDVHLLPDELMSALLYGVEDRVRELPTVVADAFSVNVFNPQSDNPCVVLGVSGPQLATVRDGIYHTIHTIFTDMQLQTPKQHEPWIPHVTLAYARDVDVRQLTDRTGPITFDRVRMSWRGVTMDIPLGIPEYEAQGVEYEEPMSDAGVISATVDDNESFAERDVNAPGGTGHNLREYWVHGPGAAKIGWGTKGSFKRCVAQLGKHVRDPEGLCAEYHHAATGEWPRGGTVPSSEDTHAFAFDPKQVRDANGRWAKTIGHLEDDATNLIDEVNNIDEFHKRLKKARSGRRAGRAAMKISDRNEYERAAMNLYQTNSPPINNDLRRGQLNSGRNTRLAVKFLDTAFKDAKINADIEVHRVISYPEGVFGSNWNSRKSNVGLTWKDHAYVSTTYDDGDVKLINNTLAERNNRTRVIMRMLVPEGTRAIRGDTDAMSDLHEILLDRGNVYRIVEDEGVGADGTHRVTVEVVPPEQTAITAAGKHTKQNAVVLDTDDVTQNELDALTEIMSKTPENVEELYMERLTDKGPEVEVIDSVNTSDENGTTASARSTVDAEAVENVDMVTTNKMTSWAGVLTVEGIESGDGRMFAANALTWDDPPLPLMWQKETSHGGSGDVSVRVGSINKIWREPDASGRAGVFLIKGSGTIDVGSEDGREVARRMREHYLRGNSVDVDSVRNADVQLVFADPPRSLDSESTDVESKKAETFDDIFAEPEVRVFTRGRIRATTLVEIPAFTEAHVELVTDDQIVAAVNEQPTSNEDVVTDALAVLTAAASVIEIADAPPRSWFDEPTDVEITGALTVTSEGRVYGYVAPSDVRHRSYHDRAQFVPTRKVDYNRFMGGETIVADGGRVTTGNITMGCGHASTLANISGREAAEHYDNTCSIVATVRVGENARGVWMAGALLPDVTPAQVRRIMACRLSGDWRPHLDRPGWREFVAALLVPVPGFPMARSAPSATSREGELVASSVPVDFVVCDYDEDAPTESASTTSGGSSRVAAARDRQQLTRQQRLAERTQALRARVMAARTNGVQSQSTERTDDQPSDQRSERITRVEELRARIKRSK